MLKKPFARKEIKQKDVETSLIELFYYPKKGPGQLWETMAKEIRKRGGVIELNAKVTAVNAAQGVIKSVLVKSGAETKEWAADCFLSTMPIAELVSNLNDDVPTDVKETAVNLPYRDFITVGLLVDRLKIKNTTKVKTIAGIVPDCWIYVQEPSVKMGRLQIFNNWSPYMVKDFRNTVWIGLEYFCDEGDEMWNMTDEEFIGLSIKEAVETGILEDEDVLDSIRIKVEKAYPAYFGTYENFDLVRNYLDGFKNLYCIGRNGQHRYNNMDHSMLTAAEAVKAIKSNSGEKESIWNVNTESEYHETAKQAEKEG